MADPVDFVSACSIRIDSAISKMQNIVSTVNVLSSEGAVVHQEELDVLGVVDEESLVAGGHHVAGLLVGTVTDLWYRVSFVSGHLKNRGFVRRAWQSGP